MALLGLLLNATTGASVNNFQKTCLCIFMSLTKKRSSKVLIKKILSQMIQIHQSQPSGRTDFRQLTREVSFACRGHWSPGPSVSWYATSLLSPGLCDISSSLLHQSYILLTSRNADSWFNSLRRGGRGCGGKREEHMGRKEKGGQSIHPSASTIQSDHTYPPASATLVTHVRDRK